jgi:predicted ribosomally synthesized peptide with SipW-like signal peptide
MKRILFGSLVVFSLLGLIVGATRAFFSDTETSTGNIFQAGVIDLLVDNTSYYNGVLSEETSWELADLPGHLFFNFLDIKPGDVGEDTISLHVNDNEAWSCMDINLTKNDDNTCTSPESADDPTCSEPDGDLLDGELGSQVNFVFWIDDGDNVLETNEALAGNILAQGNAATVLDSPVIALTDSTTNKFGGAVGEGLSPNQTYYIGKAWCFGTLALTPLAQDNVNNLVTPVNSTGGVSCDGTTLNNAAQSDILTADVSFSAVQHRNNPNFTCAPVSSPSPSPSASPSPTPLACVESFVSSFAFNNQGTRRDGSAVLANRSVPSAMFGAPQTTGTASDPAVPAGSFFSLGFTGGNIVVGFSSPFFQNPLGPDLQIFEVTGGTYPDEAVKVEVASAAAGPWTLVSAAATRDEDLELPVPSAQFVRLTDVSNIANFPLAGFADADAYDVDAVKALCSTATE